MCSEILRVDEFGNLLGKFEKAPPATGDAEDLADYVAAYDILAARALHERLNAPTLDAWLTRDGPKTNLKQYALWFWSDDCLLNEIGYWTAHKGLPKAVEESAIPESLRLPPGGGPIKVRLVMRPAKEADDGDS